MVIQNILDSLLEEKMTEYNCPDSEEKAAMRDTHQHPKRERGERSQQVKKVFRCWQCGGEGNRRVDCPTQGSPYFYTCLAYGHLSRECPAKNAEGRRALAQAHQSRQASKEKHR
ncbi:DNA-binding protein HEXBP-like [Palaemon carinicauda]|uniref:DNA-binding protein HEXBP-like n=1 Tax=Palaemon carinicauda TaxID=392227 RepID=UPI0035B67E0D